MLKNIFMILLLLSCTFMLVSCDSPNGSKDRPYEIYDEVDLKSISQELDKYYKLKENIKLSDNGSWVPLGNSTTPFTGGLDGNGKTISNLKLAPISGRTSDYGLFGVVGLSDGSKTPLIRNLRVEVRGNSTAIGNHVGIIAGSAYNAVIHNVGVIFDNTPVVTATNNFGGIVGYANGANIYNSYVVGDLTGVDSIGGVIGVSIFSKISSSYYKGTINGGNNVGGLVGNASGNSSFKDSYVYATLDGANYVGGIAGLATNVTIKNSYTMGSSIVADSLASGVVGGGYTIDMSNSVSLFNQITIVEDNQSKVGRVYGGTNNVPTMRDNYGFDTTYLYYNVASILTPVSNSTGRDGSDLSKMDFSTIFSTLGWDPAVWTFTGNAGFVLPVLNSIPATVQLRVMPAYLQ